MKKGIHPNYVKAIIKCACGNINYTVEICSNCHPFFTGKQKFVDSAGMVERFRKRYSKKVEKKSVVKK